MKTIYVGIDLGTVNSCVAVWNEEKEKAEIFETDSGKVLPSFVCYNPKSDGIFIGKSAMRDIENYKSCIYDAKRFIGRKFSDPVVQSIYQKYPFNIQGNSEDKVQFSFQYHAKECEKSPEEISTEILKYIKSCLELEFEETKIKAVITIPAYFNNEQRLATRKAAQNAGLTVLRLVKEPTAAAVNFFNCHKDAEGTTVVVDLGGGTFDVSVVEKNGSNINVKCSDGDSFLGGKNFEENILTDILVKFKREKVRLNGQQKRRLQESIKHVKEKLSVKEKASKEIEQFFDDNEDFEFKLTRMKFEQLNSSLFEKCIKLIDKCLQTNNIKKTEVTNVIMVGGSTKIPIIQRIIRDYFGSTPVFHCDDPDLSVALGAAAYASNLKDPTDYTLVLPHSFTINEICTMSIGTKLGFNLLAIVVERNTPLPIKKTVTYITSSNYQKSMLSAWYEGNFKCALKNHYLGQIWHENIPEGKVGEINFDTTVEVDVDNILTITSKVRETNRIETLVVSLHEKLKDLEIKNGEWTEKDDEHFERRAIIKIIFYYYYSQFAFINNIHCDIQRNMRIKLCATYDKELIISEIINFVSKYDDGKSESIKLMKKLLKDADSHIGILRNLRINTKRNLKS